VNYVFDTSAEHGRPLAVLAIGGNALSDPKGSERGSEEILERVVGDAIDLLEAGHRLILTHGNGPQVGHLLALAELDHESRKIGLDAWVAATQGMIGHEIATKLDHSLAKRGRPERCAILLTRAVINRDDEAFSNPTKPIGPVLGELESIPQHWRIKQTEAGTRRVVPSPIPHAILDKRAIAHLLNAGAVVVACGGGGIPVIDDGIGNWIGTAAVIDKDRTTARLALDLEADVLLISTSVEAIESGHGTDNAATLTEIDEDLAEKWIADGILPPGSMGPKVEAMLHAKRTRPEMQVALCAPGNALRALRGASGTQVTLRIGGS